MCCWAERIGLQFVRVEFAAKADVEDTRNDGVDAILGMPMRHQFHALRHLDPDCIWPGLRGLTYNDGKSRRRRESTKSLPINILRENSPENGISCRR